MLILFSGRKAGPEGAAEIEPTFTTVVVHEVQVVIKQRARITNRFSNHSLHKTKISLMQTIKDSLGKYS